MVTIRHLCSIYASLALMVCLPSIAAATSCPPPLAAAQCVPPLVDEWWCDGNAYIIGGPEECQENPDEGLHCSTLDEVELIISENWFAHEHCSAYYDVLVSDWFVDSGYDIPYNHSRRFDVHLVSPHDPPLENFCENDTNNAHAWCTRWVHCPDGYQSALSYGVKACYRVGDKPLDPDKNLGPCPANTGGTPKTPNPINIGMGNKYLLQVDIPDTSSGLTFERSYNSTNAAPNKTMGAGWQHNWDLRLNVVPIGGTGNLFSGTASARRSDGHVMVFTKASSSNVWAPDPDVTDRLVELTTGGIVSGYQLIEGATDRVETYDLSGAVTSIDERRTANTFSLAYDTFGRLTSVTDRSGRSIQIDYDDASRISAVWGPDVIYGSPTGPSVTYAYSGAGRLDSATWNGGTARQYWYENSTYPYALTGITDEKGVRYASYGYDTVGRATSEKLWSGPGQTAPVAQHTLTFQPNNLTQVLDPLGKQRDYQFEIVQGVAVLGEVSAPCDLCGGPGATKSRTYDPVTGFTDLVTDFNGNVTDYDYDSRGLLVKRIDASNDPSPAGSSAKRTIVTQWHPTFRVPTLRTTANANNAVEVKTGWDYNTRGQTAARCDIDPADTTNYVCSATTAPQSAAKVRRWVTTYCEQADVNAGTCPLVGLVKVVNGPRATADGGMSGYDDTTTYKYYQTDDATCGTNGVCPHRRGDLWKITNALNQVTTYVTYDKNGRLTRQQDANGTYTDFIYHPRGWLTDSIVRASATGAPGAGDAPTHIDYDPVGNVTKVTQADGAYLAYTYDAAHRLIKVTDNLNNTIDYCPGGVGTTSCLDATGNRRVEQVKGPFGTVKRSLSRAYNQLSQLMQVLNAAGQATLTYDATSGHDANGNPVLSTDGLGTATQQQYDPLNRLKNTIQNYAGIDPATHDANTAYAYDTRNNLRQVTDPDLIVTGYDYDGLNNLSALHSHDTGDTTYGYDKAGNRITQTDNRGKWSNYTYDALSRLLEITYPTSGLNVTHTYDQTNATTGCAISYPVGRPTTLTDGSGSTTYCYDRRGNVIFKKQVTNGVTLTTSFTYTTADRLASVTYPSGMLVTYTRDTVGRIATVTYKIGTTTTTLISSATYYPFGPLNVLTFGNGRTLTKTYDQDYAIDKVTSSASGGLTLDIGVDIMGNITGASSTIAPATPDRAYLYDPLYRLTTAQTGAVPPSPLEAYTYDKTGDRLSAALNGGAATAYTYSPGTHLLATVGATSRSYDLNGNTQTGVATGFTFNYDDKNRFASAVKGINTYNYQTNGRGERVRKAMSGGGTTTTEYVYDQSGQLLGEYTSTGIAQNEYIYLDSTPVAIVNGGALSYIETDHLGAPRHVVNPTTNIVIWKWDFLASTFGTNVPNQDPDGNGTTFALNLRFPGQYFDGETGLNYNYFRDYEAGTGRYVESDPTGLGGGTNTYVYSANQPIRYVDPTGQVHWHGDLIYGDISPGKWGVTIFSLANVKLDVESDCVNGKKVRALISAWKLSGPGIYDGPNTSLLGTVDLEDGATDPSSDNLVGPLSFDSGGGLGSASGPITAGNGRGTFSAHGVKIFNVNFSGDGKRAFPDAIERCICGQ